MGIRVFGSARKSVCALLTMASGLTALPAVAVETTFVIDEQQSSITIEASTVFVVPLNDSDTQALSGTIDAIFDFGSESGFPSTADFTVAGAAITSLNPFALTLGSPPLGANIDITDVVADITTPNPPAGLTLQPGPETVYEFDSAEFDVMLNQGTIVASGAIDESFDLADMPVTGTAPPETIGNITLTPGSMMGTSTQVDALLELPIAFTQVFDADGQEVTVDVTGNVFAESSFAVDLFGLPGDYNGDGTVSAADYVVWRNHEGTDFDLPNRDPSLSGDVGQADYDYWKANYGNTVPEGSGAFETVPEPSTLASFGIAVLVLACGGSSHIRLACRADVSRETCR